MNRMQARCRVTQVGVRDSGEAHEATLKFVEVKGGALDAIPPDLPLSVSSVKGLGPEVALEAMHHRREVIVSFFPNKLKRKHTRDADSKVVVEDPFDVKLVEVVE